MKKIQFETHQDMKEAIILLEKHNVDFTWDMYDRRHLLHLGHANLDHIKEVMKHCKVPYKIIDY